MEYETDIMGQSHYYVYVVVSQQPRRLRLIGDEVNLAMAKFLAQCYCSVPLNWSDVAPWVGRVWAEGELDASKALIDQFVLSWDHLTEA